MDLASFERSVRDPRKTRKELETMRDHARERGKAEFARVADDVLRERFPGPPTRGGGGTPTTATFRSLTKDFQTGIDAYVWLVGQFCDYQKGCLEKYEAMRKERRPDVKGRHFAKNPKDLFAKDSSRTGDSSFYVVVSSGWYADKNLSHDGKFAVLVQLSYVCGLAYAIDWDFRVTGATDELMQRQTLVVMARRLLEDFLAS
jgi:hypothetical protein